MSIHQSKMPYAQDLLPNLTWAIWGKLAECKRCKARVQEEAQLEAERQEQAQCGE
ncbi:hypothetical protein M404DRAFT_25001 [Pisolithus tinctorius Marx 270]|uniref:Uncharacterized protein n=1 Tax=Pisolithus tinctorius Marx 270 TaxID=870435 RepID=A0A0C3K7Z4_PISTI|nr:hypothetical protein M404DRAFT_25001 [Pisolithus tinctorius Marx 270]